MIETLQVYLKKLLRLHELIAADTDDSEEGDRLRDEMEGLYSQLDETEKKLAGDASGDLYMLYDEDMYYIVSEEEKAKKLEEVQVALRKGDWLQLIKLLHAALDIPPNVIARYRSIAYFAYDTEISKRFMEYALKLERMPFKLGLDIHGVIDADPVFFSQLSKMIIAAGHEVHIITGEKDSPKLRGHVKGFGVDFTHFFSITSYHESIGTKIQYDGTGPHMEEIVWNRTKANYCRREKITMHIDDSSIYGQYFTGTVYVLYKKSAL